MPFLTRTLRRLGRLARRRQLDRDLDDELRFHMEMMQGSPAGVRRRFGNLTAVREACRDRWTLGSLEIWWQDLRYAARALAQSPGFSAAAIATLALGIGINATVFTLVNAVLFKSQPFVDSRIVYVASLGVDHPNATGGLSLPDFRDLRAQAKSFESLAASDRCHADLSDGAALPQTYTCGRITSNAFAVIGQKPVLGRGFTAEDERAGAEPVAILSDALWQSRYAGSASIVGSRVRVNAVPTVVVGVMPRGLKFPGDSDLWLPLVGGGPEEREDRSLFVYGRLARGAPPAAARAELRSIAANLAAAYPKSNRDIGLDLRTFSQIALPGKLRRIFLAMLGAVGFVLLIACFNVANLLLARGVGRAREISIRRALGAGTGRILRQLLVESTLLSLAGGALGCVLAVWGARAFDAAVAPTGKPAWIDFSIDLRVLAYVAAISVATGLIFGFVPALRLLKGDLISAIKDGGRGGGAALAPRRLSGALVAGEMALALVLLAGAGLLARSALQIYRTPVGVDTSNVLTFRLGLPRVKYPGAAEQTAFRDRLEASLAAVPGVVGATFASHLPGGGMTGFDYELDGASAAEKRRPHVAGVVVGDRYFAVMRAPVLAGRAFQPTDGASTAGVMIVNRSFADHAWPQSSPLGHRLRVFDTGKPGPWLTVVGVAPDIAQDSGLGSDSLAPSPLLYLPYSQHASANFYVIARAASAPGALSDAARRVVQSIDADLPVNDLMPLADRIEIGRWPVRVFGTMFAVFAAAALLLASVGLYAVIAESVRRRTQEIGIRIALGARSRAVLLLVLKQGAWQLGIGLGLGLAGALALTRAVSGLLIGVSPTDPLTLAAVVVVLLASGAAGLWLPSRRALAVDPAITLRHD